MPGLFIQSIALLLGNLSERWEINFKIWPQGVYRQNLDSPCIDTLCCCGTVHFTQTCFLNNFLRSCSLADRRLSPSLHRQRILYRINVFVSYTFTFILKRLYMRRYMGSLNTIGTFSLTIQKEGLFRTGLRSVLYEAVIFFVLHCTHYGSVICCNEKCWCGFMTVLKLRIIHPCLLFAAVIIYCNLFNHICLQFRKIANYHNSSPLLWYRVHSCCYLSWTESEMYWNSKITSIWACLLIIACQNLIINDKNW